MSDPICCCYELAGDNPNCPIHGNPRPVSHAEAQELTRLLCSSCWRPITSTFRWNRETKRNEDFITCGTPGCPMHGFVSKRFVQQREQISHVEYREARHALRDVLPVRSQTETQILTELGLVFA